MIRYFVLDKKNNNCNWIACESLPLEVISLLFSFKYVVQEYLIIPTCPGWGTHIIPLPVLPVLPVIAVGSSGNFSHKNSILPLTSPTYLRR